jgi:hypothetical protein
MEAKTKYNIKDLVWLVYENKVVKMTVTGLGITVIGHDNYEVKYILNYTLGDITESQVFKTKEELLESL